MKKYLTIVASALLMFAGANLYAQNAQENLDKAKDALKDAQKHYDKVEKVEGRKIDACKDKISDLKLKIDKDNLAINEANSLIKQKQQTLKLKKDAYAAEKKALAADGGLSKADKMQLKEREGEVKAIANDIKNDQNTVKTLKSSISDKKNAIKREQNSINKSKAEISAAKKELNEAKQGVKAGKKAVSAEKKAAAAEAKVAAAEKKAAEKAEADAAAAAKLAAKESEKAANEAAEVAQAKAQAAEANAAAAAAEVAVAQAEHAKAETEAAKAAVQAEAGKVAAEASAKLIDDAFSNADAQLLLLLAESETDQIRFPMTVFPGGDILFAPATSWAAGYPAGSFWLMYEYTGDEFWAGHAKNYTEALSEVQNLADNHDLGFIVASSYGQGLRLKKTEAYKEVILNAAKAYSACLAAGDNIMNLELLFQASAISGDKTYADAANAFIGKALENYDIPSAALAQSWALYGFTMAYRYTENMVYLAQAEKIVEALVDPLEDHADASAAAVIASSLYELYGITAKAPYKKQADKIMLSLASPDFTAEQGSNHGFILKNPVQNFADYYYLEALLRKKAIEKI
ncbi:MAG: hypothetical protein J5771_02590 [Bacteroidales bacterium]|nr:hypothetical protein [Bacteroidales bacterium]